MDLPFYRLLYFAIICHCFISTGLVQSQSTVTFYTEKKILASGEEKVFFLCSTGSIDKDNDVVEMFFQSRRVLRFNKGTTVYYHPDDRPEGYYSTSIYNSPAAGPIGIGITINKIHTNDTGEYYCVITKSEVPTTSSTISLTVEPIPIPTCKVHSSADVLYTAEGQNGRMTAVEGANVSLACEIEADSNSIPMSLKWTRSDDPFIMFQPSIIADVLNISLSVLSDDDNVVFTCTSKVHDTRVKSFAESCQISLHIANESLTSSTISPTTGILKTDELPIFFIIGLTGGVCVVCGLLISLIVYLCFEMSKARSRRSKEEKMNFIDADANRESNASRFSRISSIFKFDSVADSDTMRRNEKRYNNKGYEGNEMIDINMESNQLEHNEDMYDSTPDSNAHAEGMYDNSDSYGNAENEQNLYGNTGYDQNMYGNTENEQNMYGNTDYAENMYGNTDYAQSHYGNTEQAQETHPHSLQMQEIYQNTDEALGNEYLQDFNQNSGDRTNLSVETQRRSSLNNRPVYAHVNKSKGAPSIVSDFSDDAMPPYAAVGKDRGKKAKSVFERNTSQYADVNDMPLPPRSSSLRRLNLGMSTSEYSSVC